MLASGLLNKNLFKYTIEMDTTQYAATTLKMYMSVIKVEELNHFVNLPTILLRKLF